MGEILGNFLAKVERSPPLFEKGGLRNGPLECEGLSVMNWKILSNESFRELVILMIGPNSHLLFISKAKHFIENRKENFLCTH